MLINSVTKLDTSSLCCVDSLIWSFCSETEKPLNETVIAVAIISVLLVIIIIIVVVWFIAKSK